MPIDKVALKVLPMFSEVIGAGILPVDKFEVLPNIHPIPLLPVLLIGNPFYPPLF